ncbi:MAG: phosphoglycerate kinase [Patescibacteria group bacterium]
MHLRRITSVKRLEGKRVLVRIDANVPIEHGKAVDGAHGRIAKAAEGIKWLMKQKARVIVVTHLGRPKSKSDRSARLAPIAARLSHCLQAPVLYNGATFGKKADDLLARLRPGGVALLENIRFEAGEEKNDAKLAKQLAAYADMFVNDAFAVSHRAHASVAAIQKYLPSYAGPIMIHEVAELMKIMKKPKKPFALVIGGAKMETKIGLIEKLGPKLSNIFIGGALATTFLAAQKINVGKSLYEKSELATAKRILARFKDKVVLPEDVRVVTSLATKKRPEIRSADAIKASDQIIDIGPKSARRIVRELHKAKTIVWNGPLGMCEVPAFCESSALIARAIAAISKAETVVGGGDTLPLVESLHLGERYTLLSTGGGAMLAFLSGEELPGVQPLITK